MSKITWRNLFRGAASGLFVVGLLQPAFADQGDETIVLTSKPETSEPLAATKDTVGLVQVAQGVTTYEQRRRFQDDPRRGQTVERRPRPQYDPLGVRMGSFVLFPQLDVQEQYESNIYATPNDEEDDFITRILPNLTLQSDWNNHQLVLETGGDFGFYADNTDENFQDYYVATRGRVDVRRSTQLRLGGAFRHLHESRESPDDPGPNTAEDPTEFNLYSADTSLRHDFGRINATLGGDFTRVSYLDPDAVGGGKVIEHDRDRNVYVGTLRVGYEIQPSYEAFILGSYNKRVYDGTEVGTGIDRDSKGYGVAVGMEVDFGGIIFGDFFAGYRYQDYQDSSLDSIDGVGGGADLTWNVTDLTTINFLATSDIRETTDVDASGRLVTTGEIGVDHELRRNIIMSGNVSVTRDDYQGTSRTDWIYRAGPDVTYLINRYLRASLGYNFAKRDSDNSGDDYTNHIVFVRLGLQY